MTTWTSLRRPFLKVGRSGRSISRQARIASSPGRPSERKNEPGIRPAAYIRSSTSIVSGKKSNWSFGCLPTVVADSSMVSSSRYAVTEPAAWRARRPVSNLTVRLPNLPLSRTVSTAEMTGSVNFFSCHSGGAPRSTGFGLGFRLTAYRASVRNAEQAVAPRGRPPVLRRARRRRSTTKAETLDDGAVSVDVGLLQVVEQTTTLADEQQQTTTAVVVVLVLLEVLGEVADAVR